MITQINIPAPEFLTVNVPFSAVIDFEKGHKDEFSIYDACCY